MTDRLKHAPGPWWRDRTPNASGVDGYLIFAPEPSLGKGFSTVIARVDTHRDGYVGTACIMSAALAMKKALEAYEAWARMPADRGGSKGPRGKAYARFVKLKDAALAQANGRDA